MATRRAFFARVGGVAPLLALGVRASAQDPARPAAADSLAAERLRDPSLAGQQRDSITAFDNDPTVIGIERRLKCTCGCTLDVYTCRTTDFTCTFSPALHREIVGMVRSGKTPEDVVAALVAREGEAMLMSPPAEGFNVAGYVVPGLVVGAGALAIAAYLSRRRSVALAEAASGQGASLDTLPVPDDAQLARLKRALDDVES